MASSIAIFVTAEVSEADTFGLVQWKLQSHSAREGPKGQNDDGHRLQILPASERISQLSLVGGSSCTGTLGAMGASGRTAGEVSLLLGELLNASLTNDVDLNDTWVRKLFLNLLRNVFCKFLLIQIIHMFGIHEHADFAAG